MSRRRLIAVSLFLIFPLLALGLLSQAGPFLVKAEPPRKADVAIVIGGDYGGRRMLLACDLLRQGLVPKVWVSGPRVLYDEHEDGFAIRWAARQGCPVEQLEGFPHEIDSTRQEAEFFARVMAERGVHSYLLITSNFHTRRAGEMFRQATPGITTTVVAATHGRYDPVRWWASRDSAKVVFFEWTKTLASWVGM
ncbi:MAG: YdcF family protein [Acidobacteria bacterium]|nr:YdcF family protein [Acidobacteriota bacterium]